MHLQLRLHSELWRSSSCCAFSAALRVRWLQADVPQQLQGRVLLGPVLTHGVADPQQRALHVHMTWLTRPSGEQRP